MVRALLPVQPITMETQETGLVHAERYSLSISDAMIAASAINADCDLRWSDDTHDSVVIQDRQCIANPFRID